ncbi:MAG TPA: hypothetical protein VHB50_23120, partial [Bryobacteraceae bacterium]|nr:hypothetical protein [Bryobacteraceae bacterium]
MRAVDAPLRRPLATGGGFVRSAPLVLLDLETDEGITGSSYVFCYTRLALAPVAKLVANLEEAVRGSVAAPFEI